MMVGLKEAAKAVSLAWARVSSLPFSVDLRAARPRQQEGQILTVRLPHVRYGASQSASPVCASRMRPSRAFDLTVSPRPNAISQSAQTVFLGTFAHCPSSGQLEILEDHLLGP